MKRVETAHNPSDHSNGGIFEGGDGIEWRG